VQFALALPSFQASEAPRIVIERPAAPGAAASTSAASFSKHPVLCVHRPGCSACGEKTSDVGM